MENLQNSPSPTPPEGRATITLDDVSILLTVLDRELVMAHYNQRMIPQSESNSLESSNFYIRRIQDMISIYTSSISEVNVGVFCEAHPHLARYFIEPDSSPVVEENLP